MTKIAIKKSDLSWDEIDLLENLLGLEPGTLPYLVVIESVETIR